MVVVKRNTRTRAQREYVKTMIHNLSLQRLTDQEIVDYLHNEKQIEIARTTVTLTRNLIEKRAEKWYIELRQSRYKYIAMYKERIDSLLSYQKKLNQIIEFQMHNSDILYSYTIIKAISELHKIELSIFNMWKQLPNLDTLTDDAVSHATNIEHQELRQQRERDKEDGYELTQIPPIDDEDERRRFDLWNDEGKSMSDQYRARMQAQYGLTAEPPDQHSWIQCANCSRWFKNQWHWINHHCIEGFKKLKPGVAVG